jgi:hypothetical protein
VRRYPCLAFLGLLATGAASPVLAQPAALGYVNVVPCRVLDTRLIPSSRHRDNRARREQYGSHLRKHQLLWGERLPGRHVCRGHKSMWSVQRDVSDGVMLHGRHAGYVRSMQAMTAR